MPVAAVKKKIVVDVPRDLFEEALSLTVEMRTTTSGLVRTALEEYLAGRRRQKLEHELEIGYLANAEFSRQLNSELEEADAEIL